MSRKDLQNNAEEIEFFSADEKKLSECVGSLERVSAPKDFNFRVKSKIALGNNESRQSGNWQWIRYLLPVGASAFVLAFVLYGTNFFAPSSPSEEMAVSEPAKSEEVRTIQPAEPPSNMTIAVSNTNNNAEILPVNSTLQTPSGKSIEDVIVAAERPLLKPKVSNASEIADKQIEDNTIVSRDITVTSAPIQLSRGFDSNTAVPQPEKPENLSKNDIQGMLQVFGLEIISEGGKFKVKSVQQNSIADRSEIRAGDVIESFDGQKTDANTNSAKQVGITKLNVLRDGRLIVIELKVN